MSGVSQPSAVVTCPDGIVIGVVGGIGSGKSSVVRWVAERFPVAVLDADVIGHDVLLSTEIKQQLRQRFGDEIFNLQGDVDRKTLAGRVFGDAPQFLAARRQLERIVHPEIRRRIQTGVYTAGGHPGSGVVLLDAAILLEAGWRDLCRWVVLIDCPREVRLARVRQHRGWSEDELDRRERSQWPLADKRRLCDVIIDNSGELAVAGEQLAGVVRRCLAFKPGPGILQADETLSLTERQRRPSDAPR